MILNKVFKLIFGLLMAHLMLALPIWAQDVSLANIKSGQVVMTWQELKSILEEIETLKQRLVKIETSQSQDKDTPPASAMIVEAVYQGIAGEQAVHFDAVFQVQIFKKGWVTLPFFSDKTGIESIVIEPEIKNELAQFIITNNKYALIAQGPGSFKIKLKLQIPINDDNLKRSISFKPPRSVVNRVSIQIPAKGVYITRAEPHGQVTQTKEHTLFNSVVSGQKQVQLHWKIEKDTGVFRKSTAQINSLASLSKTNVRVFSRVILKHVASLEKIGLELPSKAEIINITSDGIDSWSLENSKKGDNPQKIIRFTGVIDPHTPIEILINCRVRLPQLPAAAKIPVLMIDGVDTLDGFLGVEVLGNLEVKSEKIHEGTGIPVKNLPM